MIHNAKILTELHPDLQLVMQMVGRYYDIYLVEGHRNKDRQDALFNDPAKPTKVRWPNSLHNKIPSEAVDIAPFPIDWNNRNRFIYIGGAVTACSRLLSIPIRWGGDWNCDDNMKDGWDWGHFELKGY